MDDLHVTPAETPAAEEPKPVEYSKNPVLDGLEHLGHWIHVGERDVIWGAVVTIHRGLAVTKEMEKQFPTLAEETATVAGDVLQCKTLATAVALCVAGEGINLAADAGVLAALVKDGPALIQLFANAAKLLKTVGADIKEDAEIIEGKIGQA